MNLNRELIQFMKWYKNNVPIGTQKNYVHIVDDYFKYLQNDYSQANGAEQGSSNYNIPLVMASNYFLCEYRNWNGDEKIQAIEGEDEDDVKHRIVGHGMELISIKRIYCTTFQTPVK